MNKRIVLVDQNEQPNYLSLFGRGLGNDIYTIQQLEGMDEGDRNNILSLGNSDAALLIGGEPFKYLRCRYHYGIRSENYSDCAKLRRLSIEGGAFVKCTLDLPEDNDIEDFMSPTFTEHRDFSWFKQKVIHTFEEAMEYLDKVDSLSLDTPLGFDYEASGMPLDTWFELSGASLCCIYWGAFISFTDIRHTTTPENYQILLNRLGKLLEKRMDYIWVYNMQYEFQVSHRMLGVDLYNLCDASVFNILDGNNFKNFSLKWTGNMILQSTVWDTEFDKISDLIDSMLFEVVGKLKKDKHKELKVTKDNFKDTPEWKELCHRYPNYIDEFERLILEYWGNPFMCIPSDILGYYCNLDAFYTLMIAVTKKREYTEECINTFLDNIRLACRLHSSGLYIDEDYRLKYQHECHKMMAWGITYCAMARCKIKMDKHQRKMANINKFNPVCKKLLDTGNFFNGNEIEITKKILLDNIDTMDAYDTGINEGSLLMTYGPDFAEKFMDIVRDSMKECKMKKKLDSTVEKKRKIIGIIAEKLKILIGLDKLKLGEKTVELEKYIYYEKAYNELSRIVNTVMPNVEQIPENGIEAFGQKFTLLDYANYVSDNYFRLRSPIDNDSIVSEFFSLYKTETAFLAALSKSIQQLPGQNKSTFFKDRGCQTIEDAYNFFMNEWQKFCSMSDVRQYTGDFPIKMFDIALNVWRRGINFEIAKNEVPVKDIWADFIGLNVQTEFFEEYKKQILEYSTPFSNTDLNDNFFFMRKLVINYLLYKKYAKVLSTYVDGMFNNYMWVIEDKKTKIPIKKCSPNEPHAVKKIFVPYNCLQKKSKRWSSPFHTIISHSDLKDIIRVDHYENDENGNPIWIDEPYVETYFDISSAEVKSAGYASGDPELIRMFNEGIDAYIYAAKLYLTEDGWNRLDKAEKKVWRKKFKQIFLGLLYGLGLTSLSERLNCSLEESKKIIDSVYSNFPKLREYVAIQGNYPIRNSGYVNTMLGDKLQTQPEWDLYQKAIRKGNKYEEKNLEARIQRLGVNLPISKIVAC